MELYKVINQNNLKKITLQSDYLKYFDEAFSFCKEHYSEDLERIINVNWKEITPEFFYKEYIFVVCVSGFNAKIVSGFFEQFYNCFTPLHKTLINNDQNVNTINIAMNAMNIFSNKRKVKAIIDTAFIVGYKINKLSWEGYKNSYLSSSKTMTHLPYIGEITKSHLARNIGILNEVKNDLHLQRMSNYWGFKNGLELCKEIKNHYPEIPLGLIDYILFMTASTFGSKIV